MPDEKIIDSLKKNFEAGKTNWKTSEELKQVLASINQQIADITKDTEILMKSKK